MRARICGAFELRVQDSHGRRKLVVGHVMVADDEVDAAFGGISDFVDRLDAAIENYDEFHTLFGYIVYAFA